MLTSRTRASLRRWLAQAEAVLEEQRAKPAEPVQHACPTNHLDSAEGRCER